MLPLIAQWRLGADASQIGLMMTAGAVATGAVLSLVPRVVRRFGRDPVIAGSTAVMLIGLWVLATCRTIPEAFLASILLGVSNGFAVPSLSAYAVDLAPPGRLGAAMGMLRMVTDFGFIAGPVIVGVLVDEFSVGYSGALLFCGLWLVALNIVFALTKRHGRA